MNGLLMGTYKVFYPNGQLESESIYSEGERNGKYTSFTSAGVKILEGAYKNGRINGENRAWYPTGVPRHELEYNQGKICCKGKYYYPTGKLKQTFTVTGLPEDREIVNYYPDGKMESEQAMLKKLPNGTWRYYHRTTGRLKTKETYNQAGKLDGQRLQYDTLGNKITDEPFINGVKTGTEQHYEGNTGKLLATYEYKGNSRSGVHKAYDLKGNVTVEGYYRQDKKHGKWLYYDQDGKLIKAEQYQFDVLNAVKDATEAPDTTKRTVTRVKPTTHTAGKAKGKAKGKYPNPKYPNRNESGN
jgi:antitoxin component YwqK of YwqJK toxin-antitoxin module